MSKTNILNMPAFGVTLEEIKEFRREETQKKSYYNEPVRNTKTESFGKFMSKPAPAEHETWTEETIASIEEVLA